MWTELHLSADPAALLLVSLAWFFDTDGLIAALAPAVISHEAGHLLMLRAGHIRVKRLHFGLLGFEMDHTGYLHGAHAFLTLLAGPLFGGLWAVAASCIPGDYFALSAGLSMTLSVVNMMPVLPLDGGRLLELALGKRAVYFSRFFALSVAAYGFYLCLFRGQYSVLTLGLWLCACTFCRKK